MGKQCFRTKCCSLFPAWTNGGVTSYEHQMDGAIQNCEDFESSVVSALGLEKEI